MWSLPGQGEAWAERERTVPLPSKVSTPLPPGRVVWGPGLPGNGSPGQVLSRVCSSLIAAQVGRLEELGEASLGRCSGPQHRQGRARLL